VLTSRYLDELDVLGDDDIALGPHFEVKICDRFRLKTLSEDIVRLIIRRNRSQVFTSECGPSPITSSRRSSSGYLKPVFFQVSYAGRANDGLVARYRCDAGFLLEGNPLTICLHGEWRHSTPTCVTQGKHKQKFFFLG